MKRLDIKQLLPNDKGPPTIEEEETERFDIIPCILIDSSQIETIT